MATCGPHDPLPGRQQLGARPPTTYRADMRTSHKLTHAAKGGNRILLFFPPPPLPSFSFPKLVRHFQPSCVFLFEVDLRIFFVVRTHEVQPTGNASDTAATAMYDTTQAESSEHRR